jgi:glucokinase
MRYAAAGHYASPEQVISAAHAGDAVAEGAVRTYASYLAAGLASIVMLLDPEMLILAGGLAQNNHMLVTSLNDELEKRLTVWRQRKLEVRLSPLGYSAGVLGAAALAAMAWD